MLKVKFVDNQKIKTAGQRLEDYLLELEFSSF